MSNLSDAVNLIRAKYETKIKYHLSQIDNHKSQADKLRMELEQIISNIERTLGGELDKIDTSPIHHRKLIRRPRAYTISTRILKALEIMPEKFSRQELFETVNRDGGPLIDKETLGPMVSRLVKENIILTVEPSVGTKPANYKKATGSSVAPQMSKVSTLKLEDLEDLK